MSEKKWTPGPWRVFTVQDSRGSAWPGIETEDKEAVVWAATKIGESIFTHADAHLMAAAPELYDLLDEMCQMMRSADEHGSEWHKQAEAALAKARGEQS